MQPFTGFEFQEVLGHGSFGTSFVAKSVSSGQRVQVKTTPLQPKSSGPLQSRIKNLHGLHQGLRNYQGLFVYGGEEVWLVSALVENAVSVRDLVDTLKAAGQEDTMDTRVVASLVKQVLEILVALHDVDLHHGLLHPENVLVDPDGRVTLTDYGIVNIINDAWQTDDRMASLFILRSESDVKQHPSGDDIESLASLARYMNCSRRGDDSSAIDGSKDLLDNLIASAKRVRRGSRLSAKELLQHPLFKTVADPPIAWNQTTSMTICAKRASKPIYDPAAFLERSIRAKWTIEFPLVQLDEVSFDQLLKPCPASEPKDTDDPHCSVDSGCLHDVLGDQLSMCMRAARAIPKASGTSGLGGD